MSKKISNEKPWWRDPMLIFLGAILALSSCFITSWYNNKLSIKKSIEERELNKSALLVSLQAEIETNLISLNVRYRTLARSINNDDKITIWQFKQLDKVFCANLNRLGDVADVALVAEIVGFYRGLEMLENLTRDTLSQEYDQNEAKKYVSQLANYLHASIYLHARIQELTKKLSHPLTEPSFSDDRKILLQNIKDLRKKLGSKSKHSDLNFHNERNE